MVAQHYLTAAIFGLLQVVIWHLHLSRAGRSRDKSLSAQLTVLGEGRRGARPHRGGGAEQRG